MGAGFGDGARMVRESAALPPFGDQYHDLDTALANCADVGIRRVAIVTQSKPQALIQHIQHRLVRSAPGARRAHRDLAGGTVPQAALSRHRGCRLSECRPHRGDRARSPVDRRERPGSAALITRSYSKRTLRRASARPWRARRCRSQNANDFDVLTLDERSLVTRYTEKPVRPTPLPYAPGSALVSIGTYAFERGLLTDSLHADASDRLSSHDFGRELLPLLVRANGLAVHTFRDPRALCRPRYAPKGRDATVK